MASWSPEGFAYHLEAYAATVSETVREQVEIGGTMIAMEAVATAPEGKNKTHPLKDSIHADMASTPVNPAVEVKATVEYAVFPETGIGHGPARHYMRNAIEEVAPIVARDISRVVVRGL